MSGAGSRFGSVSAEHGSIGSTIRHLWPFIWPVGRSDLKLRLVLAVVALMASKAATTLVPFAYKDIVDAFAAPGSGQDAVLIGLSLPLILVVAYGAGNILDALFQQLRDVLFASVGQHAVRRLADRTFQHLHSMSMRFHLQRRTGGVARIIDRGTKGIESIVRFALLNTAPTVLEFLIVSSIFLWLFGPIYLAVLVATIAAYVWFTVAISNWRIGVRRTMNESDTDAAARAVDSLINFETVKYFGNEAVEAQRFDGAMARYERAAVRMWTSLGVLNFGQATIFWCGTIVIGLLSAQAVFAGTQSPGDFVLVVSFMMQIYRPLNFIGMVYRELRQGFVDLEAMFRLLDQSPEIQDAPDAAELQVTTGVVRFENVAFAYGADRPILKNISFEVPAGRTVAIVGPSGAGKSTISRLIFRFYDVDSGRITIDGQDIRSVAQASLRASIGMVPQDTVLFNDSIGYNIRYGRVSASDAEVARVAEKAQIAEFIASLPEKYDTQVGERGLKLSGGEKQRVAIARTLLKDPRILILDEATSALDTHTEREIQSALNEVARNRTTLVIAHRLSTVVGADEILVLKAGEIIERGSHVELLAQAGLYAEMWNRQLEAAEASERLRQVRDQDREGFLDRDSVAAE